MRLLLDTHVWLWMVAEPERLSRRAVKVLENPNNDLLLSAASAWEISIKQALGRVDLGGAVDRMLPDLMQQTAVAALPITHPHAILAGQLPRHHADPFDRMLIAQAAIEGIAIVTRDAAFSPYDVETIAG